LDLDPKSLARAIKAGEEEAEKMIPEIKKKIEQKRSHFSSKGKNGLPSSSL
jgi:hypothetical protein